MVHRSIGCLLALTLAGAVALPASAQQTPRGEQQLIERVQQMRERLQGGGAPAQEAGPAGAAEPVDQAAVAELKQRLASDLGVDVLDVRPIEANGRQAYAVKVMNPGGNSNDAFLVSTLVVDRESGEVLGRLPQSIGTSTDFSGGGVRFEPLENSGPAIRRRTYR
jgi:hypothetical protein